MDSQQPKRSAFSGKIGFVLSAAGASVGLGNIWRFPYLAAKYGVSRIWPQNMAAVFFCWCTLCWPLLLVTP